MKRSLGFNVLSEIVHRNPRFFQLSPKSDYLSADSLLMHSFYLVASPTGEAQAFL